VILDGQEVKVDWPAAGDRIWLEKQNGKWTSIPGWSLKEKGPHRYGTFKDAIQNHVVFVYGTGGSDAENVWSQYKARYDAEVFWYQGNGSIDIISDKEFSPEQYKDRNVVLYGNSKTNRAWKQLLKDCPIQIDNKSVKIGDRKMKGKDLACLFIYPRPDSDKASVGVVGGTGIEGMRLTDVRPYLYPGYAYPDFIVFTPDMLKKGNGNGVKGAGYFGIEWQVSIGDAVFSE